MFNALSPEDMGNILKLQLKKEAKMAAERGLTLEFTPASEVWMLAQNDEPQYGARPLRRIIRRFVREPLADFLLKTNPPAGTVVRVDVPEGGTLGFVAIIDGKEVKV